MNEKRIQLFVPILEPLQLSIDVFVCQLIPKLKGKKMPAVFAVKALQARWESTNQGTTANALQRRLKQSDIQFNFRT